MVEITFSSFEIYLYLIHLYLHFIISLQMFFLLILSLEGQIHDQFIFASKYLGKCLAYTWDKNDFFNILMHYFMVQVFVELHYEPGTKCWK